MVQLINPGYLNFYSIFSCIQWCYWDHHFLIFVSLEKVFISQGHTSGCYAKQRGGGKIYLEFNLRRAPVQWNHNIHSQCLVAQKVYSRGLVSSLWQTHHSWPHNLTQRTPCFCKHFTIHRTPVKQDQTPYLTPICQHKLEPHREKISSFSGSSNYLSTVTIAINSDPTK